MGSREVFETTKPPTRVNVRYRSGHVDPRKTAKHQTRGDYDLYCQDGTRGEDRTGTYQGQIDAAP